jgi:hypothetical protein
MATITITFADSKANKMARGIAPQVWAETPPTNVAEAEAMIKDAVIEHMKLAFRRGDKATHNDGFVPEDDANPQA